MNIRDFMYELHKFHMQVQLVLLVKGEGEGGGGGGLFGFVRNNKNNKM